MPDEMVRRAMTAAREIVAGRYAKAACGFVAGSIVRGEGTAGSDIDLVVIFDELEAAWRESFHHGSFPVEAFVHDAQTLEWFIQNDFSQGYPVMAHMIADGRIIGRAPEKARAIQDRSIRRLACGPIPDQNRLNELRYLVSDLFDDLRGTRSAPEIRAIAAELYQPLGDLILLGRGRWSGKGKWLPRRLAGIGDDLARQFDEAFRAAFQGELGSLMNLLSAELDRAGGHYFDGDLRMAPSSARKSKT